MKKTVPRRALVSSIKSTKNNNKWDSITISTFTFLQRKMLLITLEGDKLPNGNHCLRVQRSAPSCRFGQTKRWESSLPGEFLSGFWPSLLFVFLHQAQCHVFLAIVAIFLLSALTFPSSHPLFSSLLTSSLFFSPIFSNLFFFTPLGWVSVWQPFLWTSHPVMLWSGRLNMLHRWSWIEDQSWEHQTVG